MSQGAHSELQESPKSRLLGAGFTRQLQWWVTPDNQRILDVEEAIAKLDSGEIELALFRQRHYQPPSSARLRSAALRPRHP